MALLTDGNPNDANALQVYESGILDVAAIEKIDLSAKLTLATEEISETVVNILLDHTRAEDPQSNVRRTIGVSDVVVTPQMKRWHALHTLAEVYRDAFNNQLNDRYRAKVEEYRELSRGARENTIKFGIGLALNPVAKAGAPALSQVAGVGQASIYYVQVSWVAASGAEGAPSDITAFTTALGTNLSVQAVNPPGVAAGFNVYIGMTASSLALQNPSPLAIGATFATSGHGLIAGRAPGNGQPPDVYVTGGPTLRRG